MMIGSRSLGQVVALFTFAAFISVALIYLINAETKARKANNGFAQLPTSDPQQQIQSTHSWELSLSEEDPSQEKEKAPGESTQNPTQSPMLNHTRQLSKFIKQGTSWIYHRFLLGINRLFFYTFPPQNNLSKQIMSQKRRLESEIIAEKGPKVLPFPLSTHLTRDTLETKTSSEEPNFDPLSPRKNKQGIGTARTFLKEKNNIPLPPDAFHVEKTFTQSKEFLNKEKEKVPTQRRRTKRTVISIWADEAEPSPHNRIRHAKNRATHDALNPKTKEAKEAHLNNGKSETIHQPTETETDNSMYIQTMTNAIQSEPKRESDSKRKFGESETISETKGHYAKNNDIYNKGESETNYHQTMERHNSDYIETNAKESERNSKRKFGESETISETKGNNAKNNDIYNNGESETNNLRHNSNYIETKESERYSGRKFGESETISERQGYKEKNNNIYNKTNTNSGGSFVLVNSEIICYRTDDVLLVVALTCLLNFTFVLVIWAFVRWFSQKYKRQKYYCPSCRKSINCDEQDDQFLLLSEEYSSSSSGEEDEESSSGESDSKEFYYNKKKQNKNRKRDKTVFKRRFNSLEDLRYYYT